MVMNVRGVLVDAFLPNWAWRARLRAAEPGDRWKIRLLRIGAGIVVGMVLLLLGVRIQRLG